VVAFVDGGGVLEMEQLKTTECTMLRNVFMGSVRLRGMDEMGGRSLERMEYIEAFNFRVGWVVCRRYASYYATKSKFLLHVIER
jgi:hypothetical protein